MIKGRCTKDKLEQKEMSQLQKKTSMWLALTQDMFLPKVFKFRRGIRGIDWVICMCCQRSWIVSRNLCWWMCLWPSSQPVRARVGAGNTLTASRLPAWHQNRWMPLIVTVCNVFNSIIPFLLSLSFFPYNISLLYSWRQFDESLRGERSCTVCIHAVEVMILFITLGELSHFLLGATTMINLMSVYQLWSWSQHASSQA